MPANSHRRTLTQAEYETYMRSSSWTVRRAAFLAASGRYCRACGTTVAVEVHHRTYARLGVERSRDLVALCRTCHTALHDLARKRDLSVELATRVFMRSAQRRTVRSPTPTRERSEVASSRVVTGGTGRRMLARSAFAVFSSRYSGGRPS